MKPVFIIIILFIAGQAIAQPTAYQSTTGPIPPKGIDITGHVSNLKSTTAEQVISGVPAYLWYRGCGPTSVGMILGYYDTHGFQDLIAGDASTQTTAVNTVIASGNHYDDYSLPLDSSPNLLADKSELPEGDEHADNCIADYMFTSQSIHENYYGWSWSNHIKPSWENYIANHVPEYTGVCNEYSFDDFPWDSLVNNINRNCPVVLLVDTNADGFSDHFICVNGYKTEGGVNYYCCRNTWDTNQHWYAFAKIASGTSWGIVICYTFKIQKQKQLALKVFLEGSFNPESGTMNTSLNEVLPLSQPFNTAPWYYEGTENVSSIPADVVDWVLVELRDASTPEEARPGTVLNGWPRAFFLKSNGAIVDTDGTSLPMIGTPIVNRNLFVVIHHRNHLAVMSSGGATLTDAVYSFDFTTGLAQAYEEESGYKMSGSKAVMVAGDIDQDGSVFVSDFNGWAVGFGNSSGYFSSDIDMDRNVFVSDYNKWAVNFGSTTEVGSGNSFADSRDGHVYKYITIGSQTWMTENMAYLPAVSPFSAGSYTLPYYYVMDYTGSNVSEAKATTNYSTYGVLYNWEAAKTACPSGWHLPTDEEWKILEKNQGMSQTDADATGWRNSGTVGGKLKEAGTTHWASPNIDATNTSGLTALPGGMRSYDGQSSGLGYFSLFWTASESGSSGAWFRYLYTYYNGINRDDCSRNYGNSVRCLMN